MELSSSKTVAQFLRPEMENSDAEEFWALALNSLCHLIRARMLFRGTVDACFIHPRDVFRFALICNASSLIVAHNHPSGICVPSQADVQLSHNLKRAGVLLQIPILDHIIVTSDSHFSFAESLWRKRE